MLQNPYVFGLLVVLATALATFVLQQTSEPEKSDSNKKLAYKILFTGAALVFALGYFIYRPDPVLTEPFPADA